MSGQHEGRCGSFGEAGCGCCEGLSSSTSRSTPNRPGRNALDYRIGRHSEFLDTMKARISSLELDGERSLSALRTREKGDASIAMLDAWATVADVLTFYQERIANEGYLRTATERRSVLELARLIGYRPRPGVAASVHLAYTIDSNTPEEVIIPAGARSQSVPGPDELPQSFETSEALPARAGWNELKPRISHPPTWQSIWSPAGAGVPSSDRLRLYIKGVSSGLTPGEPILIEEVPGGPLMYRVIEVEPQAPADRTRVELIAWGATAESEVVELVHEIMALMEGSPTSGVNATEVHSMLEELIEHLGVSGLSTEVGDFVSDEDGMLADIRRRLEGFTPAAAPNLVPWLEAVESFLAEVSDRLDELTGAAASDGGAADAERVNLLAIRPSPPRDATRLRRSLSGAFGAKDDASFKLLGTSSPDLAEALPVAWANYEEAAPSPELKIHALRLKTSLFGHNFPERRGSISTRLLSDSATELTTTVAMGEWPIVLSVGENGEPVATESPDTIYLEGSHEGILPGSWIVLDFGSLMPLSAEDRQVRPTPSRSDPAGAGAGALLITQVTQVSAKVSRSEYGGSSDSTRLRLADTWIAIDGHDPVPRPALGGTFGHAVIDNDFQVIRGTAVYARSELLELAEQPILAPVCLGDPAADYLELDGLYADLEPGRLVIVTGERADIPATPGVKATEAGMIVDVLHALRRVDSPAPFLGGLGNGTGRSVGDGLEFPVERRLDPLPGDRVHTFIRLDRPLSFCYVRDAVTIYANVVRATHGESREEVLGSGDGSRPFASFELKQRPLTYVPATTPDGIESTLDVFVDGVRWKYVKDYLERGPRDRVYTTRTTDDARTSVLFGDGETGARPPTGVENLIARYRSGIGAAGNVRAGQVSLLQTRPLGVKEVFNPLRASGGADREARDEARNNAPLAVKALDRLVSVADYADFARTFAGIGKAVAAELSDGRRTVVHVTVAGAGNIPIDPGSELFVNLQRSLREFGDHYQPIALDVRELLLLVVEAGVKILPDHRWEVVVAAVRTSLHEAFGFQRRQLGQDVVQSEIISTIQAVRGVDWVDLDAFGTVSTTRPDDASPTGRRLATPDEIGTWVRNLVDEQIASSPPHRAAVGLATPIGAHIRPAQIAVLEPAVPATLALNRIP